MKRISDSAKHILPEAGELSAEQKLWIGGGTLFRALRPLILYTFLPAALMTLGMLLPGKRSAREMITGSGNFYYTLGIILTVVILHKCSKRRGSSLYEDATLEYKELDWKKIFILLGMGLGFGFFFSALVTVIPLPEMLRESYRSSSNGLNHDTDPLLALLSTAILAPVAEEIVFRGYMLNRLLSWFKENHSTVITSVIFALCHVSLVWIVYAFLMGLLLSRVSIEEDNIAYSIALHLGFNVNVVPIWIINRTPALEQIVFANHLLIAAYGAVACAAAVWCCQRYRKETKKW